MGQTQKVKVAFLGDSESGKSSIIAKILTGKVNETYTTTIKIVKKNIHC